MTDQTQTQDPTSQVVPQVSVQQVPPVPVQSVPVQSVQQSVPVQPVAQLQPEAEAQPVQQPVPVQPVQPTQPVQQPVPQQVPVQPAPQPAPAETQGFWQTLRGGLKNLGQKAVPMLMDTAGKTLQTSAQAVGGVAQTTVNSGANLVQGIGSAVQNNQEGNFIQNVGGSIKDTASTIIQSGGQEVNGVVKVGKEAVANLSQQVPAQLGGNQLQSAINTVTTFTENSVQTVGQAGKETILQIDQAVGETGRNVVHQVGSLGENVANKTAGVFQDLQKKDEGVTEGQTQQPVVVPLDTLTNPVPATNPAPTTLPPTPETPLQNIA